MPLIQVASKKRYLITAMFFITSLVLFVDFIWDRQTILKNHSPEGEFLEKALYYMEAKDWDQAGNFARKTIEYGAKNNDSQITSNAYSILGTIMHQKGKESQAIEYFENAVKVYPQGINASMRLAEIYALAGNIDRADLILEDILKMPLDLSDRVYAYYSIGSLLVYSGRFVEGLANLENALDLSFETKNYSSIYPLLEQISDILFEFHQPLLVGKKIQQIKNKLEHVIYKNDSLGYLIELTIPLKLAISKNDWENAERLLWSFEKNIGKENVFNFNTIYFLLKRGLAKDWQLIEEKIRLEDQINVKMPIDLRYNIAYYLVGHAKPEQATFLLEEILQTKELFINGNPLYYNKALALLSEIYEISGNFRYSEELCNKFLQNWKKADPELEIFGEIQTRYKRLKNGKK
jgi:Tfp pilus assembly protein PilF